MFSYLQDKTLVLYGCESWSLTLREGHRVEGVREYNAEGGGHLILIGRK